ncbi:hypothetical protein C1H46_030617 [Malus baccata]|uniref:Uncharacterized protein n=1 Tax=Malus baccata TaxID=106549 RepID=A0A540LBL7_MALBA|nr:hypothetical protein C1H46_030617 [Malus baccata]
MQYSFPVASILNFQKSEVGIFIGNIYFSGELETNIKLEARRGEKKTYPSTSVMIGCSKQLKSIRFLLLLVTLDVEKLQKSLNTYMRPGTQWMERKRLESHCHVDSLMSCQMLPPKLLRRWESSLDMRLGFGDVFKFGFVDPPAPEALAQALQQLIRRGVLDNDLGELTQVGNQMADTVSLSM